MIANPEILVCNHLLLVKKIFYNLKTEFLKHDKIFLDTPGAIKPLVGDVVLVCKETPSLGLVTEILSPRRVVVRHKHRGSNADHQYHCKILALIFRPESPVYFMSIFDKPQMPHLLEDFWTRLKQKLTWRTTQPATAVQFIGQPQPSTAVQFIGQPQPSNSCAILQPWNLNRYFKASSVLNQVWLTQFTVNWYGLHFILLWTSLAASETKSMFTLHMCHYKPNLVITWSAANLKVKLIIVTAKFYWNLL